MTKTIVPISIGIKKTKEFKNFVESLENEVGEENNFGIPPERFIKGGDFNSMKAAFDAVKGIRQGESSDIRKFREEAWQRGKRK